MSTKATIVGHDFEMKRSKVIKLDVFVNSDEDPNEVLARVAKAARGQMRNAVVTAVAVYAGDEAKEAWRHVQKFVTQTAANPRAVEVDEDMKPR